MATKTETQLSIKQIAHSLIEQGTKSGAHHASIKSAYKSVTGHALKDPAVLSQLRQEMQAIEQSQDDAQHEALVNFVAEEQAKGKAEQKAEPTPEPEPKAPKAKAEPKVLSDEQKQKALDEFKAKYPHVVSVSEWGAKGPARVVIQCQDPQTKQDPNDKTKQVSICNGLREIAIQDAFQVHRCVACQTRFLRVNRRNRARTKAKQEKQAIRVAAGK